MSKIVWWLTPTNNPTRRIAGPYAERKDAVRESILRLSWEAKQDSAVNFRMPNLLVPTPARMSDTQVETFQVLSGAATTKSAAATTIAPEKVKRQLPPGIYKLPAKSLEFLCVQLGIEISNNAGKADIISILEQELA